MGGNSSPPKPNGYGWSILATKIMGYKKHGRRDNKLYSIEEYALEDAFCDEDGDFLFSVSYDLADTDPEDSYRSLQQ